MSSGGDLSWDEVHRALIPLMKTDNRRNLGPLAREYLLLAGLLVAGFQLVAGWQSGAIGPVPFALAGAAVVFGVGVMQHRLSGLAHDASHYTLFRNKLGNELISDLFLLFPLVAMTQKYRAAHLGHHRFVNDPARDPDLIRLNHPEPRPFPMRKADFWRIYVLEGLWPPSILKYLIGRARSANLDTGPQGKPLRNAYGPAVARRLRGSYWLLVLALVHGLGAWTTFGLFWVVPLLTVYPLLMQLREIAHHSNAPDDGDLTNSRVFEVHPLLNACVFPYGQAFHVTHHLFAMVPHDRVAEAHRILRRYPPYREQVVVCRGFFFRTLGTAGPSVLDILAAPRPASHSGTGIRADQASANQPRIRATPPNGVTAPSQRTPDRVKA